MLSSAIILKLKALVLAILLTLSILPIIASPSLGQKPPYRLIEVNEYGLVYVYDVLPGVGGSLSISYPKSLVKNLVNYACLEDESPELRVGNETFSIVVDSKPGQEIHLTTVFKDVVSWDPGEKIFRLVMPMYPQVSGLGETSLQLRVKLPEGSEVTEVSPGFLNRSGSGVLSGVMEKVDLSKGGFQNLEVSFRNERLRIIDVISTVMHVELPERRISISLKLRQLGGEDLRELNLKLPKGSKLIDARDPLGELPKSYDEEAGELRITLRQPLTTGSSTSITYSFQPPQKSSLIDLRDNVVRISPYLPLNSTIWLYRIELTLRGGKLYSWKPEPVEYRREYPEKLFLAYRFTHIDPINIRDVSVELGYEPGFSLFQILPYLILGAVIFTIASITAVYRLGAGKPIEEEKPVDEILDEYRSLALTYQAAMDLLGSDKIYNRAKARRILLELRSETRRRSERLRRLARELRGEKPEYSEELKLLEESARRFEEAIERVWEDVYPYLSGSMPRRRLDEILERICSDLKKAYNDLSESVEKLKVKL